MIRGDATCTVHERIEVMVSFKPESTWKVDRSRNEVPGPGDTTEPGTASATLTVTHPDGTRIEMWLLEAEAARIDAAQYGWGDQDAVVRSILSDMPEERITLIQRGTTA